VMPQPCQDPAFDDLYAHLGLGFVFLMDWSP
jgi:hypothetical protein